MIVECGTRMRQESRDVDACGLEVATHFFIISIEKTMFSQLLKI